MRAQQCGRSSAACDIVQKNQITWTSELNSLSLEGVGMTSRRTRDRLVTRLKDQGITNQAVLDVMANTPRHLFLDEALSHRAYEDTSLPIGHGQTLSQPYIVARMTQMLIEAAGSVGRVLEIGTGSGYQTAVLAQFVDKLWSVERIKPLQDQAKKRLKFLGLKNIEYRHADGGFGWPEAGPFDAILSAAAPRDVPDSLLAQLAPEGVLVIPLGDETQALTLIQNNHGDFTRHEIEPVKFVPLLSGITS